MALWGRRKLFPKIVFSHWYTWKTGMLPLPERCSLPAEPAPCREKKRHSVYLESGGIWPESGRCMCSRWAFDRKMTGGARPQERTADPCIKRKKKDRLEISNSICRKNDSISLKSPPTHCMNLFNRSFHHRYSKGKCHPNLYGITTNSKYTGPVRSVHQSCFTIFQNNFSLQWSSRLYKCKCLCSLYTVKKNICEISLGVIFQQRVTQNFWCFLSFSKPVFVSE